MITSPSSVSRISPEILLEDLQEYQIGGLNVSNNWGWKLATTPDDVMNFLNGTGAYKTPVKDAKICSVWKDNHLEFYVFYQK